MIDGRQSAKSEHSVTSNTNDDDDDDEYMAITNLHDQIDSCS